MELWVSKASAVSIITAFTRHQLSIDVFFSLLSTKHDIKKCLYLKAPEIKSYILSPGQNVFLRKNFFLAVCLSKRYTKVPEVVFATVFFFFCKDYQGKLTTFIELLHSRTSFRLRKRESLIVADCEWNKKTKIANAESMAVGEECELIVEPPSGLERHNLG